MDERPTPVPPSGPETSETEGGGLAQLWRLLLVLRRRWMVVVACTFFGLAAALVAGATLPRKWEARASVVLHMSGPQILDKVKGVTEDAEGRILAYREYYQTQRRIIASRTIAASALEKLGLADDPAFLGIEDIDDPDERKRRKAEIDPIERLRELVRVREVRNSRILEIRAIYPDPEVAAALANAVVDAYLEHVRATRTRLGTEARKSLSKERESALEALRAAEKALADFKKAHEITSVSLADRQNVITQSILALSTRLKETEAERIELEATYAQARRLAKEGNLAGATMLPEHERSLFERLRREQIEAERDLEQIAVEYGPKAPAYRKAKARHDVITARLAREADDLIESLEARLRAAREAERKLAASLAAEQKKALALSELEREYRELERNANTTAEAYGMVAKRETEVGITNRVEAENIEVLDRATVPSEPISPRVELLAVIGLLSGTGFGMLLALGLDLRDLRIRSLPDLERILEGTGLPVLGVLPLLPPDERLGVGNVRAQRRRRDLHALLFPRSLMAERCRGLRTALAFAQGEVPLRTLMITSPSSAEGKSSTAMNLAISFCQASKDVILVDADMRRPRIHQVFPAPVERERIGLAQALRGEADLDQACFHPEEDAPDRLSILPCGEIPDNPAELLDGPGFRRVLAELTDRADVVILDSPPVLPVTDPVIVARQVDGVLLVVRCGSTTRAELLRAIHLLRQGDTNLLGVVLNQVDARQESYAYRYSYYVYGPNEAEAATNTG